MGTNNNCPCIGGNPVIFVAKVDPEKAEADEDIEQARRIWRNRGDEYLDRGSKRKEEEI